MVTHKRRERDPRPGTVGPPRSRPPFAAATTRSEGTDA